MLKRVKKISAVFMGAFTVVSILQNNNLIETLPNSSTSVILDTGDVRKGDPKEGHFIAGIKVTPNIGIC